MWYMHIYMVRVFLLALLSTETVLSGEKKLLGWELTRPRLSARSSHGLQGRISSTSVWSRRLRRIGTEILIVVSCSLHSHPHLWTCAVGHGAQSRAERVQQRWFRHPGRLQVVLSLSNWEETHGQIQDVLERSRVSTRSVSPTWVVGGGLAEGGLLRLL